MNIKVILRALSFLFIILSVVMLSCVFVAIYYGEYYEARIFGLSIISIAIPSLILMLLTRGRRRPLSHKDGFLLVFLAWFGMAAFAAVPMYFSGAFPGIADAFFEAVSGVTATGASVAQNIEALPMSVLMWRSLCNWMGGMGIIVLTVALLPLLGIGGMQLLRAEHGLDAERLTARAAQTGKVLWLIYTGFTLICFVLYKIGGMGTFDAVNHAFSAMATGGFSTKNASIGAFNSAYIEWVTIGALCVSGCNFALYYRLFTGEFQKVYKNTEVKVFFSIIIICSLIVVLTNLRHETYVAISENIRISVFNVVSVISTTGYFVNDPGFWPAMSQFILFALLFVGGCSGSTAGGIKVIRIAIIFKQALIELRRLIHPRAVFILRINNNVIKKEHVYGVVGFVILYLFTVLLIAGTLSFSGTDLQTSFSTGLSMVGNVGIGSISHYPAYVKVVLAFGMLVGRLELYSFYVLLMPLFWKK